jgi:hypothetical protein
MAGTIIADFIRTDASRLSLNVGNTTFATINASGFFSNTGTQLIAANGAISGASVISGSIPTGAIADASITNAKLSLSANDSNIKTALNASGSAGIYAARAWINFDGTGTPAIRASGNISSITDNSTGNYYLNFTTAMPDGNYSAAGSVYDNAAVCFNSWETTRIGIYTRSIQTGGFPTGTVGDYPTVNAAFFR